MPSGEGGGGVEGEEGRRGGGGIEGERKGEREGERKGERKEERKGEREEGRRERQRGTAAEREMTEQHPSPHFFLVSPSQSEVATEEPGWEMKMPCSSPSAPVPTTLYSGSMRHSCS